MNRGLALLVILSTVSSLTVIVDSPKLSAFLSISAVMPDPFDIIVSNLQHIRLTAKYLKNVILGVPH